VCMWCVEGNGADTLADVEEKVLELSLDTAVWVCGVCGVRCVCGVCVCV